MHLYPGNALLWLPLCPAPPLLPLPSWMISSDLLPGKSAGRNQHCAVYLSNQKKKAQVKIEPVEKLAHVKHFIYKGGIGFKKSFAIISTYYLIKPYL